MKICLLLLITAGTLFSADAARSSNAKSSNAKSSNETSGGETATQPVTRTLVWPDGTRYVGTVFDGKRAGKGTITWQDGTRFIGNFKDDLKNGPGTMILSDGTVYSGYFENDILIDQQLASTQTTTPASHSSELTETMAEVGAAQPTKQTSALGRTTITPAAVENVPGQSTETANAKIKQELATAIQDWAAAWSSQNVDQYLASYAAEFAVPDKQTRIHWNALRRLRLEAPKFIEVILADLDYEIIRPDEALINFTQTYRSKPYSDVSSKFLHFKKQGNTWLIIKEGNR